MRTVKTYYFECHYPGEKKPQRSSYRMTMEDAKSMLRTGWTPIMSTEQVSTFLEAGDPMPKPNYGPSAHSRHMASFMAGPYAEHYNISPVRPGAAQTAPPDPPAHERNEKKPTTP